MIESIFPVWQRVFARIEETLGQDTLIELHSRLDKVIGLRNRPSPNRSG
jgi:hypothetical protein